MAVVVTGCGDNFGDELEVDASHVELPIGLERVIRFELPDTEDGRRFKNENPELVDVELVPGGIEIRAMSVGTAHVRVSEGTASHMITIVVMPPAAVALALEPALLTLQADASAPLKAIATYSDGRRYDVSTQARWSSNAPTVAHNTDGRLYADAAGTAAISATFEGLGAKAAVTVGNNPGVVIQLQVTPAARTLPRGAQAPLTATAVYGNGTTRNVTSEVVWTSSTPSVASVSNDPMSSGVVTGNTTGHALITARYGEITGVASITVSSATLGIILIEPWPVLMPRGYSLPLVAVGVYSDGTVLEVSTMVTWSSADTAVATVSNLPGTRGRVTAVAAGRTTITASHNGVSASVPVTVIDADLTAISVSPVSIRLPRGGEHRLTVLGTYSDGTSVDLTAHASISSRDNTVATVAAGVVTAVSPGTTTIDVEFGGHTAEVPVTVTSGLLLNLQAGLPTLTIPRGVTLPLNILGAYDDGSLLDVTQLAGFTSDNLEVVGVSNVGGAVGLITGQSPGTATITAHLGDAEVNVTVHVTDTSLIGVTVEAALGSLLVGETGVFTALAHYSDGSIIDVTDQADWSSSNTALLTVSNLPGLLGNVLGTGTGTGDVIATFGGLSGATPVTVGTGCHVVVNEIKAGSLLAPRDEFIELYNPCAATIDLAGTELAYRGALGGDQLLVSLSGSLAPGAYAVYAGSSFTGTKRGMFATDLSGLGGGVALRQAGGAVIDSVGYGINLGGYTEGAPALLAPLSQSVARTPNGRDTNMNATDFALLASPTPNAAN